MENIRQGIGGGEDRKDRRDMCPNPDCKKLRDQFDETDWMKTKSVKEATHKKASETAQVDQGKAKLPTEKVPNKI